MSASRNERSNKLRRFRVVRQQTAETTSNQHVWWRAYSADGESLECGASTMDRKDQQEYVTENPVFAWLPHSSREVQFSPHEILPIPYSSKAVPCIDFEFDGDGTCRPSHGVVYVTNLRQAPVRVTISGDTSDGIWIAPSAVSKELVYVDPTKHPSVVVVVSTDVSAGSKSSKIDVTNGDTIMVNTGLILSRSRFSCPIPEYDIPIRCVNYSGKPALVKFYSGTGIIRMQGIHAGQAPTIIWVSSHPTAVEWSTRFSKVREPYKPGMALTIRSRRAQRAAKHLLDAKHAVGAPDLVELLEEAGELTECASSFVTQRVEYSQIPLLSEKDWSILRVPMGSKHRILDRLRRAGRLFPRFSRDQEPSSPDNRIGIPDYDVFLSHRHVGGEDLAQAIKLQLQVGGYIRVCMIVFYCSPHPYVSGTT